MPAIDFLPRRPVPLYGEPVYAMDLVPHPVRDTAQRAVTGQRTLPHRVRLDFPWGDTWPADRRVAPKHTFPMSMHKVISHLCFPFLLFAILCPPALSGAASQLYVTGNGVNLRRGPTTSATVITQLSRGTVVSAIGRQDPWVQVVTDDETTTGWLHGSLLAPFDPLTVTGNGVNVRALPDQEATVLTTLPAGAIVAKGESRPPWTHITILASGRSGWVHNSLLAAGKQQQNQQRDQAETASATKKLPAFWQGRRTMADGTRYIGQFKHGLFHGSGVLIFPDGRRYSGTFKNGVIDGKGIMTMPGGSYDGQWKNGKFNGQGVLTRFDGSKFDGLWKDNRWTGKGTFTAANGDRYEGEWRGSTFHGHGTMHYADGRVVTGQWRNGRFVGPDNATQ